MSLFIKANCGMSSYFHEVISSELVSGMLNSI